MNSPPSARIARGGEGSGVGGLSASAAASVNAAPPPTPDPSPPLRGGRGKLSSPMLGALVRDALDRTFLNAHGRAGERLHHFAGAFGIGDPFGIEIVRASRHAAVAFAGIDLAGVATVHQLEQMVLGLSGASGIADQRL